MRDSTLRCWRGVQNPAVLRSADHCDEQRVGPIGTFTLRTRCARGGLADRGCTISSAGDTRRGHSQRQQRNQNRIGSTGYHAVCSGAEVEPTARDTRSPTQPRSTPTSPRCAARSSSTHRRRRRISVHTFRRRTRYRRDISDRDELHPDVRFGQRPGFGAQGRRVADHRVVSIWPSNTRFDRRFGSPARYRSERSG